MWKLIKGEAHVTEDPAGCEYCNIGSDCVGDYGWILLAWLFVCVLVITAADWVVAPMLEMFDGMFLETIEAFLNS